MAFSRRSSAVACLVAFISWNIATKWFPTGRLVIYAFLAGIIVVCLGILALIFSTSRGSSYARAVRSTKGKSIKTLAFAKPSLLHGEIENLAKRLHKKEVQTSDACPKISRKIHSLLSYVLRDFIESWYIKISEQPTFTNEIEFVIKTVLANVSKKTAKLDVAEFAILRILPILTTHVKDFAEAERIVRGENLGRDVTDSEDLQHAIATKYRNGRLHPAAALKYSDTAISQKQYLRTLVQQVLPSILPNQVMESSLFSVFTRELIAVSMMLPLMRLLAEADFWNQLVDDQGRAFLQERKKTIKLRAALQEYSPVTSRSKQLSMGPKLRANDNEREFERFVRTIRALDGIADVKRLRSEVTSQLQKESNSREPRLFYLRRLEICLKLLHQKVEQLTANNSSNPTRVLSPRKSQFERAQADSITIKTVLYNASGLSAFMEYMDRIGLIRLVQLYLVVDGFRTPLETDMNQHSPTTISNWTETDRLDMAQIYESYLTRAELQIPQKNLKDVSDFLHAGSNASRLDYVAARRSIFEAQKLVLQQMQDPHFLEFKRTDVYYKWLASENSSESSTLWKSNVLSLRTHSQSQGLPRKDSFSDKLQFEPLQLRRSAASTSNLKDAKSSNENSRRSLDERARAPLFDDDYESDQMAESVQSLGTMNGAAQVHVNDDPVIKEMQSELNNIIGSRSSLDVSAAEQGSSFHNIRASDTASNVSIKSQNGISGERERPNIASLGLVGEPTRGNVFLDDLFSNEENFMEDEHEDSENGSRGEDDNIHEAAPGDLGLVEAIAALDADIQTLAAQESIVDSLTRKATLINNTTELRILRKSKTSLEREMRHKELQRQQYVLQENENNLHGRAKVSIQSVMVANSADGGEYALYIIQVSRNNREGGNSATWVVPRRYSEFHDLNKRLKERYPEVRNLEFPRRKVVLKLQTDFLQKRRLILEKYLQSLLLLPSICRDRQFRTFLSQRPIGASEDRANSTTNTRDLVSRIYDSVTDGMEDFLGNIPVLDQLSIAGHNLISAARSQSSTGPTASAANAAEPNNSSAAAFEAELQSIDSKEVEPFVKPVCDAFLELFELDRANNWLRGRAIVLVLHQLLGSTVERKVRESVESLLTEANVVRYLDLFESITWPDGKLRTARLQRSTSEKARSKREADLVLSAVLPEIVGSIVGRSNAQGASRKFLTALNNERLNTHLLYVLLDEIISTIFEIPMRLQGTR